MPDDNPVVAYADQLSQGGFFEEEEVEAAESWVSFRLGDGSYAVPVDSVQEVLRVITITRVPHTPPAVRGVTNMRGRVLPVVDLGIRLGFGARDVTERTRILVVPGDSGPVGLLVDQVDQMLALQPSSFQEPPDRLEEVAAYARAVVPRPEELLVLLELEPLLRLFSA